MPSISQNPCACTESLPVSGSRGASTDRNAVVTAKTAEKKAILSQYCTLQIHLPGSGRLALEHIAASHAYRTDTVLAVADTAHQPQPRTAATAISPPDSYETTPHTAQPIPIDEITTPIRTRRQAHRSSPGQEHVPLLLSSCRCETTAQEHVLRQQP